MKYVLISAVVMLWSKINKFDFIRQIGHEYPEIKSSMRSYDRVICHDQFDEMKGGQNPDVGLSIVTYLKFKFTASSVKLFRWYKNKKIMM